MLVSGLLVAALIAPLWSAEEFAGTVVKVLDGDTVEVLTQSQSIRVRLHGIDAPESSQAFGTRARQALGELVFGQYVVVRGVRRDDYGRIVAVLLRDDGTNVNHRMVERGMAWWYRRYAPGDRALERLEFQAKLAGQGLWSDPNPTPPWEWRAKQRGR